jgi:glycine cleavage system aminomethyltransferase T
MIVTCLNGYLPDSGDISLRDITRDVATLLVTGPKSPAIIAGGDRAKHGVNRFPMAVLPVLPDCKL